MDERGYDLDADFFIQHKGLPAHQQPERIFTDLSSRPRGILVVPSAAPEDPLSGIRDTRHREVTAEVLEVFMGPPTKEDPNLIKLKETGMTLARRLLYLGL